MRSRSERFCSARSTTRYECTNALRIPLRPGEMVDLLSSRPKISTFRLMTPKKKANSSEPFYAGYVALIGRPNAGKSTLLNRLVGEKIAAVSNKPQTTRFKILGIVTRPEGQIVLVDTPGVHKPGYELNRRMMAAVHDALLAVDLVCLIRDAAAATGNGDRFVLDLVKESEKPSLLLLNKTDRIKDKSKLLSLIEWYNSEHEWKAVVPISALKGDQVEQLLTEMVRHLPEGEPLFSED